MIKIACIAIFILLNILNSNSFHLNPSLYTATSPATAAAPISGTWGDEPYTNTPRLKNNIKQVIGIIASNRLAFLHSRSFIK